MKKKKDIVYYIKIIRKSEKHDLYDIELYKSLGLSGEPPYGEWVATWILKCIKQCFSADLDKQDILLASFALLKGYTLKYTTIQKRLLRYIHDSNYLKRYPSKSHRRIELIEQDLDAKDELEDIRNKIERMERMCVDELIAYIRNISDLEEHITDLKDYGKSYKKQIAGRTVTCYSPKLQQINNPKRSRQNPKTKAGEQVGKPEMIIKILQLMACTMQDIPKKLSELPNDKWDSVNKILFQSPEEQNDETVQEQYRKIIKIIQLVMGIAFFFIVCTKVAPINNQENKKTVVGQAQPSAECFLMPSEDTDEVDSKFEFAYSILKQIIFLKNEACQEEYDEETY